MGDLNKRNSIFIKLNESTRKFQKDMFVNPFEYLIFGHRKKASFKEKK